MQYLTKQFVKNVAQNIVGNGGKTHSSILEEKRVHADTLKSFDVFLSHAREDKAIVLGIVALLEMYGKTVYVDWISDLQLDCGRVTPLHADVLRYRMQSSASMLYLTTGNSSRSVWMPWELGYFDGHKPDRIAILPVLESGATFQGQEFLGLYPVVEFGTDPGTGNTGWSVSGKYGRVTLEAFIKRAPPL